MIKIDYIRDYDTKKLLELSVWFEEVELTIQQWNDFQKKVAAWDRFERQMLMTEVGNVVYPVNQSVVKYDFHYFIQTSRDLTEKRYYSNSSLHRLGKPAITRNDGTEEYWYLGLRHNRYGYAIKQSDGGEEYWLEGKPYSYKDWYRIASKPTLLPKENDWCRSVYLGLNGEDRYVWFNISGLRHRIEGPAVVDFETGEMKWYLDGCEVSELEHASKTLNLSQRFRRSDGAYEWRRLNKPGLHNDSGPAFWNPELSVVAWYHEGCLDRSDGPAWIKNGTEIRSEWLKNGLLHRIRGPAITIGENKICTWYLDGTCYNQQDYWDELGRRNLPKDPCPHCLAKRGCDESV